MTMTGRLSTNFRNLRKGELHDWNRAIILAERAEYDNDAREMDGDDWEGMTVVAFEWFPRSWHSAGNWVVFFNGEPTGELIRCDACGTTLLMLGEGGAVSEMVDDDDRDCGCED